MFSTESKIVAVLRRVFQLEGGLVKRLDEHRELVGFLEDECTALLEDKPWVVGWLRSQDRFLSALLEVSRRLGITKLEGGSGTRLRPPPNYDQLDKAS